MTIDVRRELDRIADDAECGDTERDSKPEYGSERRSRGLRFNPESVVPAIKTQENRLSRFY